MRRVSFLHVETPARSHGGAGCRSRLVRAGGPRRCPLPGPVGHGPVAGGVLRRLGGVPPGGLRPPRGHGGLDGRAGGQGTARRRRRDRLLGDEPAQPGRHPVGPGRSRRHGCRGRGRGAEGAGLHRLPESRDRAQRVARLRDRRTAARQRAALSRRGARAHARAGGRRRHALPARAAALHGERHRGLVAPGGPGRLARTRGLHARHEPRGGGRPLPDQPRHPRGLPRLDRQADRTRHSRGARRADARVPVGRSVRRPRRPATRGGLASDREAPVPGRPGGRARARALERVVVGVGDVRDAGQRRSRQAGRRLHLSVGARSDALRCHGDGGSRLRCRSDGRFGGARRCLPVPLERRLVPHGRADRADERGRFARGRTDGAARAHARTQAHDGRPDRGAARPSAA